MSRRWAWVVGIVLVLLAIAVGSSMGGADPAPAPPGPPVEHRTSALREASVPTRAPVRVVEEEVPEAPPDEVRCEVGRALEGRACSVYASPDPAGHNVTGIPSTYDGTSLSFTPHPDVRMAMVSCPNLDPFRVTWNDARVCTVPQDLPAPADAPLIGTVKNAADLPEGTVFLEGCGARQDDPVDADGSFFVQTAAGRCSIRAWRQAGALRLPGPWVEIEAVAGIDTEVGLEVPVYEPAGMGIGFRPQEDGIGVTLVRGGSPAERAGLAEGDVIQTIDGASTIGMDTEDFLRAGIGPAGSSVVLVGITSDGQPFEVRLVRRPIDPG